VRCRDELAEPDDLILDEMGMCKFCFIDAQDLCEILEERMSE
jgi:hypothetical protein